MHVEVACVTQILIILKVTKWEWDRALRHSQLSFLIKSKIWGFLLEGKRDIMTSHLIIITLCIGEVSLNCLTFLFIRFNLIYQWISISLWLKDSALNKNNIRAVLKCLFHLIAYTAILILNITCTFISFNPKLCKNSLNFYQIPTSKSMYNKKYLSITIQEYNIGVLMQQEGNNAN